MFSSIQLLLLTFSIYLIVLQLPPSFCITFTMIDMFFTFYLSAVPMVSLLLFPGLPPSNLHLLISFPFLKSFHCTFSFSSFTCCWVSFNSFPYSCIYFLYGPFSFIPFALNTLHSSTVIILNLVVITGPWGKMCGWLSYWPGCEERAAVAPEGFTILQVRIISRGNIDPICAYSGGRKGSSSWLRTTFTASRETPPDWQRWESSYWRCCPD